MKRILSSMFLAALMMALATGAQAASLSIVPATSPGPIPGGIKPNDFLGSGNMFSTLTTVNGYYGANIVYSVVGTGSITIDFFGGEAGFNNKFLYNGSLPNAGFEHTGSPVLDVSTSQLVPKAPTFTTTLSGSGLLDFKYTVQGLTDPDGLSVGGPTNGFNPNNIPVTSATPANFFASCQSSSTDPGGVASVCGTTAAPLWLWLDDNGGVDDNDFDDYVVRITVADQPVPEPTSFALLGSGLIGLGLMARKVRK